MDKEVAKYVRWNVYKDIDSVKKFFEEELHKYAYFKGIYFGNELIGSITLQKGTGEAACRASLGFVLSRDFWGKGIATKAVKTVISRGFEELKICRIDAIIDPRNIASRRVCEKSGMVQEGYLKNYIVRNTILYDRILFATYK